MDGAQQIHDDGSVGTAHSEIDDCNILGMSRSHVGIMSQYGNSEMSGKQLDVFVEVCQQNVLSEILQSSFCVARQPVCHYFFLGFHILFVFLRQKNCL